MNDLDSASIDPAGGARPATTMAQSLSAIVDRFGPGAFFKPEEVRLLLRQDWPDSNREIDLLLAALADGVPQRLLAAHGDTALRDVLLQSVDRLIKNPSFDPTTAMWAVRTWAIALALPVTGFDGPRVVARPAESLAASLASVVTPLAGARRDEPVARPVAEAPPPAVVVAHASVPAAAPVASPPVAPREAAAVMTPPTAAPPQAAPATPARAASPGRFPFKVAIAAVVTIVVAVGGWIAWRQMAVAPVQPTAVVTASKTTPEIPATPVPEPATVVVPPPTPTSVQRAEPPKVQPAEATPSLPSIAPSTAPAASAVAGNGEPPTIARIDVPRIAQGKPFQVAVSIVGRSERVASVERRTAAASGRLAPFVANAVATLSRTPTGALLVPFRAIDEPGPVTVEFSLVDRSGVRGPTRRVELNVLAAAVAPPAAPAPAQAPSARAPCSRSTCGSVVSVRTLDAPGAVELIVRMDDRSIQTVRQTGRWTVGSRVQRIDERYVPVIE